MAMSLAGGIRLTPPGAAADALMAAPLADRTWTLHGRESQRGMRGKSSDSESDDSGGGRPTRGRRQSRGSASKRSTGGRRKGSSRARADSNESPRKSRRQPIDKPLSDRTKYWGDVPLYFQQDLLVSLNEPQFGYLGVASMTEQDLDLCVFVAFSKQPGSKFERVCLDKRVCLEVPLG